ncbi:conserved exported protein of unknown function [Nitrospira sp. KM1]|uniref:tetratricopeptide repeat protein n=1 Tax=Nitrospira sp. KM1 TaxID=1936990 RepID=UPI0013A73DB0|nr:tetratricopeptide repeat protein [Nitrospira sp. KM1]BCA56081.1 conserved exported protein of unknown function [Nitrospira sp. KM1]
MHRHRLALGLFIASMLLTGPSIFAQTPEEPVPIEPLVESPPPVPTSPREEPLLLDDPVIERDDAAVSLSERREAVKTAPDNPDERIRLAEALHRIGDLDAAVEECRTAIQLQPDNANAHLQLGVMLMAKQDWRGASSVLKEAVRLNAELTPAYYSLASVLYTTGNVRAAIQTYRQALELRPNFPDARYRLALLLKLTDQRQEAAQLMEEAALGGIPQAQFFVGNAYKAGQGVEKDPALAILWWSKASRLGHQAAGEALSKFRKQALSSEQSERRRKEALDAFRTYRDKLWSEFPDYKPSGSDDSLGALMVAHDRIDHAVPTLLKETYALSESAESQLAKFYESGWGDTLSPFERKILICLEKVAGDGFLPAKKSLARIYGKGIGMEPDLQKAKAVLRGIPKPEAKAILDEFSTP